MGINMFTAQFKKYAERKYQERKKIYGSLLKEIEEGFLQCTKEEELLIQFLYGTMPLRDAAAYEFSVFLSYVRHALWLRANRDWCKEMEEDIFLHHVLYYRINSEDITDCRNFFYEQVKDRIENKSIKEAVLAINYWCAEHVVYEATDERTASPMTMYRCGRGRCGEESTFTVTVLRSAGIPARQVYAPRWAHCDDNHAWTEVYISGKWYYLGACEPEEDLNRGWFTGPANRALLIHSRSFSDYPDKREECMGKEGLLTYYNHTASYAKTKKISITVKDTKKRPLAEAAVVIEILNMAEFFPAAHLITNSSGKASITLGLGNIRIRAYKEENFQEKKVFVGEAEEVALCLSSLADTGQWVRDVWESQTYLAPKECLSKENVETKAEEKEKAEKLKLVNSKREKRFLDIFEAELAASHPDLTEILKTAGENGKEIKSFLKGKDIACKKAMLKSLSKKDWKDLKSGVLVDHLCGNEKHLSEEIYVKYLLCPRIAKEELTPYRSYIRGYFNIKETKVFLTNPEKIWDYIIEKVAVRPDLEYETICATPIGCLRSGYGSLMAQKILFVAICRSLFIPARLESVTEAPQYYKDGCFVTISAFKEKETAVLLLEAEEESLWNYYNSWTIGKFSGSGFVTRNYEDISFSGEQLSLSLETGIYRLIATYRMPSGDQQAFVRVFNLSEKEQKHISMPKKPETVEEKLKSRPLIDFLLEDEEGKENRLLELVGEKASIIAFMGAGEEPTEHVLNEMLALKDYWTRNKINMLIILRDVMELKNETLKKVLETLPDIKVFFDRHHNAEKAATLLEEKNTLPLLILLKDGLTSVYATSGYHVGSVELIIKLLQRCRNEGE